MLIRLSICSLRNLRRSESQVNIFIFFIYFIADAVITTFYLLLDYYA